MRSNPSGFTCTSLHNLGEGRATWGSVASFDATGAKRGSKHVALSTLFFAFLFGDLKQEIHYRKKKKSANIPPSTVKRHRHFFCESAALAAAFHSLLFRKSDASLSVMLTLGFTSFHTTTEFKMTLLGTHTTACSSLRRYR
jgi:hypothetical protein